MITSMLRKAPYISIIVLFSVWGEPATKAVAADASGAASDAISTAAVSTTSSSSSSSGSTASQGSSSISASPAPPANAVITTSDGSESRKFFTISTSLREIYDNNIFTAKTNQISSFETQISPSILFDFPNRNSDFSFRETFTMTYYSNRPGDQFDLTNEAVVAFQHSFSDRFSFNVSDQFRYYTEPSLFQNVGTLYYNGDYIANTFNGVFNAQWTPLVSTVFSYANTYIDYMNTQTAIQQNSVENTGSATLGFAILPKITLTFGGIIDDINYLQYTRGYTSYTGTTGINWQALPSLSFVVAAGGEVTDTTGGTSGVSPYGSFGINWRLGARSTFGFNYVHEVVPTDVVQASGQEADRIGANFRYDILPNLTAHLDATFTHGIYQSYLIAPNTISSFDENDFAIDGGLSYHINDHFDVSVGDIYSTVSSGLNYRDYNRNQAYVGLRGTY